MARTYSLLHYQPGWRTIQLRPIPTRLAFYLTVGPLAYHFWTSSYANDRVEYANKKDAEIFAYKRENGLLTEGYVNHYAQALNNKH